MVEFLDRLAVHTAHLFPVRMGSALELCRVVEGCVDIYPGLTHLMECDIAAAYAIVLEDGKQLYRYDSEVHLLKWCTRRGKTLTPVDYKRDNLH